MYTFNGITLCMCELCRHANFASLAFKPGETLLNVTNLHDGRLKILKDLDIALQHHYKLYHSALSTGYPSFLTKYGRRCKQKESHSERIAKKRENDRGRAKTWREKNREEDSSFRYTTGVKIFEI